MVRAKSNQFKLRPEQDDGPDFRKLEICRRSNARKAREMAPRDRARRYLWPAPVRIWVDSRGPSRTSPHSHPGPKFAKEAAPGFSFHRKRSLSRPAQTGGEGVPSNCWGETFHPLFGVQHSSAASFQGFSQNLGPALCLFEPRKVLLVPAMPPGLLACHASSSDDRRVKDHRRVPTWNLTISCAT